MENIRLYLNKNSKESYGWLLRGEVEKVTITSWFVAHETEDISSCATNLVNGETVRKAISPQLIPDNIDFVLSNVLKGTANFLKTFNDKYNYKAEFYSGVFVMPKSSKESISDSIVK